MVRMPRNAKLILNPTSGAPGFSVENVFCLPGVPSILKSMLGGLKNKKVGGEPILSHTISLRTVESEIANSLTKVQNQNKDVEIGSYPFFHAGKLGVSIVLRSENQSKIDGTPGKQNTFPTLNPGAPLVGFKIKFAFSGIHTIFCLPSLNSPGL